MVSYTNHILLIWSFRNRCQAHVYVVIVLIVGFYQSVNHTSLCWSVCITPGGKRAAVMYLCSRECRAAVMYLCSRGCRAAVMYLCSRGYRSAVMYLCSRGCLAAVMYLCSRGCRAAVMYLCSRGCRFCLFLRFV